MKKYGTLLAVVVLLGVHAPAQQFPPGYVDPAPLLAAAAREIGEANFKCVTFSGTGYGGAVGQTFEHAVNVDWPRIDSLANYTRTINWETGTSKETFDRKPGLNPASWKYGLGWLDGTPTQKNLAADAHRQRQVCVVTSTATGAPVAAPPEDAERYQLDLWLNPPGFLKAARLPGANPRAFWRWEQIEKGRDGNVVAPEKMHVVAITVLGKYRMDATINSQNQIQRIKTTVSEPAMGDFNIEHESTDQMTFGNVKWPIAWHSHQGWDDNWQFYSAEHRPQRLRRQVPERAAERLRRSGAGARRPCSRRSSRPRSRSTRWPTASTCWAADRRTATWWSSTTSSRCSRRRQRGAQPRGDRADREAGAGQADPLADQLASALRSHRRHPHLPPHRRDRSSRT